MCGPTLAEVIRSLDEVSMTPDTTSILKRIEWLHGLSVGLKELHDYDVVHGDYKSTNIVMGGDLKLSNSRYTVRQARMIDFGHSGRDDELKIRQGGTVGYRSYEYSPSVEYDNEFFTLSVDVFSLGIVFIELLLASPIQDMVEFDDYVEGNTPREQLEALLQYVPLELQPLVGNMLHWDQAKIPSIDSIVRTLSLMLQKLQRQLDLY
jgi:serine/threonine protein kinase